MKNDADHEVPCTLPAIGVVTELTTAPREEERKWSESIIAHRPNKKCNVKEGLLNFNIMYFKEQHIYNKFILAK